MEAVPGSAAQWLSVGRPGVEMSRNIDLALIACEFAFLWPRAMWCDVALNVLLVTGVCTFHSRARHRGLFFFTKTMCLDSPQRELNILIIFNKSLRYCRGSRFCFDLWA